MRWCLIVAAVLGAAVVDGSEWNGEVYRLHPSPLQYASQDATKFYGRYDDDEYWFRLKPKATPFFATVFFDLDMDATTKHSSSSEWPPGYEMYAEVSAEKVDIIQGCVWESSCSTRTVIESLTIGNGHFTKLSDGSVEFRIAKGIFLGVRDIGVKISMYYESASGESGPDGLVESYPLYADLQEHLDTDCSAGQTDERRSAVLYDDLARDMFYYNKSYVQGALSMQHQVRQVMPHDLIRIGDLLDISKSCHYTAIVIPDLAHVEVANWKKLVKAFFFLNQIYGVGIITAGEFLIKDEDGEALPVDSYYSMSTIFGIRASRFPKTSSTSLKISSTAEMFWDKAYNEEIMDTTSAGVYLSLFEQVPGSALKYIQAAKLSGTLETGEAMDEGNGILLIEMETNNIFGRKTGRMAHYATIAVMANSDFVWRSLTWIAESTSGNSLSLVMTRNDGGIFTTRNDMDTSRFYPQAIVIEEMQYDDAVLPWYTKYNFVSSYYINIGNDQAAGQYTDWDWARELYGKYLDLENEIGSHSYTHPYYISQLSESDLKFEFDDSAKEIGNELGLDRVAAAQPGNPPDLKTPLKLEKFFSDTYFSCGASLVNAGYPNAFGYLTPESEMVYVAPNMQFDFSLKILNKTPPEMEAHWKNEFDVLSRYSNSPVFHWPIHDYAIMAWNGYQAYAVDDYSQESIENLISYAYGNKVEFITTMQLNDRIRSNKDATFTTKSIDSDTIRATVSLANDVTKFNTLGHHAIKLKSGSIIDAGNHYAYSDKALFVPSVGGSFDITFGTKAEANNKKHDVTRIVELGMRMELIEVFGDGTEISFSVRGKGKFKVIQRASLTESNTEIVIQFGTYEANWSNSDDRGIIFTCTEETCIVSIKVGEPLPTTSPVASPSASPPPEPSGGLSIPGDKPMCAMKCKNKVKVLNKIGISESSCRNLVPLPLLPCGCDLNNQGAIDVFNGYHFVSLDLACPHFANNRRYKREAKKIFKRVDRRNRKVKKNKNAGSEYICSQICGAHNDCDYFVYVKKYNECLLYSCDGLEHEEINFYKDKTLRTGYKCYL